MSPATAALAVRPEMAVVVAGPPLLAEGIRALLRAMPGISHAVSVPLCPDALDAAVRRSGCPSVLCLFCVPGGDMLREAVTSAAALLAPRVIRGWVATSLLAPSDMADAVRSGMSLVIHVQDGTAALQAALRAAWSGDKYYSTQGRARPALAEPPPDLVSGSLALSRRESEVALLATAGLSNAEISDNLYIDITTVKSHLKSVFRKTGVQRRSQLAGVPL